MSEDGGMAVNISGARTGEKPGPGEFDENDLDLRHFLSVANQFPARWVAKEQP